MAKSPSLIKISGSSISVPLNENFSDIEQAFGNTLSRDGSTPNQMEADIDMNSNDLLNVGDLQVGGEFRYKGLELTKYIDGEVETSDTDYVYIYETSKDSDGSGTNYVANYEENK